MLAKELRNLIAIYQLASLEPYLITLHFNNVLSGEPPKACINVTYAEY